MSFPSVVKEIERLSQEEGLKDDEIAQIIGCSRATINRERKRHNIPTANLINRKDKSFVCKKCNQTIYIRRKERKQSVCNNCKAEGNR